MSGKENDTPSGEARDNAAVDDKGKAPVTSAAQPTLAASGPEAVGSVNVHPTVQTRCKQWHLKPGDVPKCFDLTNEDTAGSAAFFEWAKGLAMKGKGKAPVPSAAVGVAPFAGPDAGGPSAAAAAAPSAKPSSSSSPSHRVDLAVPTFEDGSGKTREATREEIRKLLESFVVRTAEGTGETGKFPAALRAYFPKNINPDYHAEKSTVVFFSCKRYLSKYELSNKQEDEVIPGRLSNSYRTEGMTTAEMVKALKERAKKHKLSRKEKKRWLDLETVEILTGKECDYSIEVDVGWKDELAREATRKAKRSQRAKTKRVVKVKRTSVMRPRCYLDLTAYLCDEIGVEIGTVAVLERFDKTISEVPIYALTIVGKVELPRNK